MNPSKKPKLYHYNIDWEEQFFFTMSKEKCICLICNFNASIPKKGNLERHFNTKHKEYNENFPIGSSLRKKNISDFKTQLTKQQLFYTKTLGMSKAANSASFAVSNLIAKHKKPFDDGPYLKEAFLNAARELFKGFNNQDQIISSIQSMPLSRNTVTNRVEEISKNLFCQLQNDIYTCKSFSLQFDESTDILGCAQLCVFVRLVFGNFNIQEELLCLITLKETTRGIDIYNAFKNYVIENKIPLQKLKSITTDGAPSMIGKKKGFITLCRDDKHFPKFLAYHCLIHQHVLCAKHIKMQNIMNVVVKIINLIRSKPLQRRKFRNLLEEVENNYGDLLLHAEVRWLSRGKILQRFRNNLPEVLKFLGTQIEKYTDLQDNRWLLALAFFTDITSKLNEMNLKLQGKDKNIGDFISHHISKSHYSANIPY